MAQGRRGDFDALIKLLLVGDSGRLWCTRAVEFGLSSELHDSPANLHSWLQAWGNHACYYDLRMICSLPHSLRR